MEKAAESNPVYPYGDCVMSVKIINEEKRCRKETEPDGYGCAVGCGLHQDFDVCNYQRSGKAPYVTGTLILPDGSGDPKWETAARKLKKDFSGIRFFCLPGNMEPDRLSAILEEMAFGREKEVLEEMASGRGKEVLEEMASGREKEVLEDMASGRENGAPEAAFHKRYFIGMDGDFPNALVGAVAKSSLYHIPLIPGPKEALCCSGFLKYAGKT